MKAANRPDIIDVIRQHDRRLRRLETRTGGYTTENFIFDPVTARALPPAFASASTVVRVAVRLGVGGPINVDMVLVQGGVETVIHSFAGITGDGAWHTVTIASDGTGPGRLSTGDSFYPVITSGEGSDLTASFVMTV